MNDQATDPFDELMRRALHEEADRIQPADALPEIRARAHAQRRPSTFRRPWLMTVGAAAVGTAAAIGAFTVFNGSQNTANDGDGVAGPGTTTAASGAQGPVTTYDTTSPAPSAVPSSDAATPTTVERGRQEPFVKNAVVPVYWLGKKVGGQSKSAVRLYRTWARVSGQPAVEAVRIMTSKQADDPDYYSVWRGAAVNTVTRAGGVVTVDFKQLPNATLDADDASVAAQQLVYTVQGALKSTEPVQITQGGRTGTKLFGQVDTAAPLDRAQAADVQALVWIESPAEGETLGTPLTVKGTAAAFESTVNYRVTNLKTFATEESYVNTAEGQTFSPFVFKLALTPGAWKIEAFLISPADGSVTDTDSKTVVVR